MVMDTRTERPNDLRRAAAWEAERFELPSNWKDGRPLVAGLTIDGPETRDRDDAIAIRLLPEIDGGYQARISIADVGSFLPGCPGIEGYARSLGETRYLRGGYKSMIPRTISENALSILNDRDEPETPVLTVAIDILPDGTIGHIHLLRERVQPTALTYDEVADLRDGASGPDIQDLMAGYEEVAKMLRKNRKNGGGITAGRAVDDIRSQESVDTSRPASQPGELIVSEFMILANTAIAEFMYVNNIPGLYRNQILRKQLSPAEFNQLVSSRDALAETGEVVDHAYYSTSPQGHASLNLPDAYCHFTSPLRRFADFVNHANLVAYLEGREYPYQGERLEKTARHLNNVQEKLRYRRTLRQQAIARPLGAKALRRKFVRPEAAAA